MPRNAFGKVLGQNIKMAFIFQGVRIFPGSSPREFLGIWGSSDLTGATCQVGILGYSDIGILGYSDIGILGYSDIGIFGYSDIGIFGYWDIRILGYWDIRIFGYWDIGAFGYWDIRIRILG